MKKNTYIIIIGLLLLILPTGVGAKECNNSCKISDAPAPALTEYFANVEKITDNILGTLSEAESERDDEETQRNVKSERGRIMSGFNSILSFGDYFGSFDYYISLPITNEVPREVKRDHDKIERQTNKLKNILEKAEKRGTASTKIESACNGVVYCDIGEASSARSVLAVVIRNNQLIGQIYRASVTEKPGIIKDRKLTLVSADFIQQIESYYNKDTLASCSECEGGFTHTIREKMSNISFKNNGYKEGVQKWKDAWAMLRGGSKSNPGYKKREAELLSQYLSSQGMAGSQADNILESLDRYNTGGLSASNPLFNSAYYAQSDIDETVKSFEESLKENFQGEETVPYEALTVTNTQVQKDEDIKKSIATIYEDQLPFALTQDVKTQELQLRIIRMHTDLVVSINALGKLTKKSEKLCDKQGTGMGKCSFR